MALSFKEHDMKDLFSNSEDLYNIAVNKLPASPDDENPVALSVCKLTLSEEYNLSYVQMLFLYQFALFPDHGLENNIWELKMTGNVKNMSHRTLFVLKRLNLIEEKDDKYFLTKDTKTLLGVS